MELLLLFAPAFVLSLILAAVFPLVRNSGDFWSNVASYIGYTIVLNVIGLVIIFIVALRSISSNG